MLYANRHFTKLHSHYEDCLPTYTQTRITTTPSKLKYHRHSIINKNEKLYDISHSSNIYGGRKHYHISYFHFGERALSLGLKSIRLFGSSAAVKLTPKEASDFFKRNFPCSKVIVNIRSDVAAQVKSIEKINAKATKKAYKDGNRQLKEFAQWLGPEMGKLIQMEDWTTNVTALNQVVEWLGFKDCVFKKIVHENSNGLNRDFKTNPSLGPHCRAP